MCDIFDYTNLVKTATCHTKNANPTLIDVILTNKPSSQTVDHLKKNHD
jgi:hypothetical protein